MRKITNALTRLHLGSKTRMDILLTPIICSTKACSSLVMLLGLIYCLNVKAGLVHPHLLFFCFSKHFVSLRPETRDVATCVSGRKWVQSTEREIVNGSFCNLCALAVGLALSFSVATKWWQAPRRAKQPSTVAIPLYRFLWCWCLEMFITSVVSALQSIVCLHTIFGWSGLL